MTDVPTGPDVGESELIVGDTVTVDVLNQLIRENPENMTQAIRGWINKGNKASKN